MSDFAEKIRERIDQLARDGGDEADAHDLSHGPLSEEEIERAEARLDFPLPTPLRRLYATVGNGGYGPAYGLLGLVGGALQEDGNDAVGMYRAYRTRYPDDPHWSWPTGLLPVVHLGCAMFLCVDSRTADGEVVWFEPNPHADGQPWTESFIRLRQSFEGLMRRWADGEEILDVLEAATPLPAD